MSRKAIATLLSATFGVALPDWAKALSPALVALYGLFVLWLCQTPSWSARIVYLLPILLGFDNLVAGLTVEAVPVVGLISGLMALLGLNAGATVARWLRIPVQRLAGAAIIIASGLMVIT